MPSQVQPQVTQPQVTQAHAARRSALRDALADLDLEAALITSLVNVRYLTGYTGSNGALLLGRDAGADVFATDGRYAAQSVAEVPDLDRLIARPLAPALLARAVEAGVRRVGFESHVVTVDGLAALAAQAPGVDFTGIGTAVEALRTVKDAAEIAALTTAAEIADRAFAALLEDGGIRAGRTEAAIGRDLDFRMLELGAEAVSFDTIVAGGPHSAIPHHQPGDRPVAAGELLTLDFGAAYAGYHSDMTRTLCLGGPADWQRELYDLVAAAQRAGVAAATVGAGLAAVDAAAREPITAAGHGAEFVHGLGHGIGLEIHEAPMLAAASVGTLGDCCVVTVEPGVYLDGRGGVRIEDSLVVRPDGPQVITTTTKDLLSL